MPIPRKEKREGSRLGLFKKKFLTILHFQILVPSRHEDAMAAISSRTKIRLLTVGDGDLSLSLALARAYGKYISLTASVLDSKERLQACYPDAPLEALTELDVEILYEVDATQLHERFRPRNWDLVCFHHPHLGLASLEKDESDHANRHFQLISHYLYSACVVSDSVHICLCGRQPETWRLLEAAECTGLEPLNKFSTSVPFSKLWTEEELPPAEAKPEYAAPRRYRFGKLGSRHMLGKFGYRHRRTEGELYKGRANDTNVSGSMHFLFRARSASNSIADRNDIPKQICRICRTAFHSEKDLEEHMRKPAVPDTTSTTIAKKSNNALPLPHGKEPLNSISCTTNADGSGTIVKVEKDYEGKRLRWLVQHGIKEISKKQAKVAIHEGRVFVNDSLVLDASRLLSSGDIVFVKSIRSASLPLSPEIEILYRKDPILVAFKPSGVRTKGHFPGTLEASIHQQEGQKYDALSPLDSFCPGLCALIKSDCRGKLPSIVHLMTALVFNAVPESWKPHREVTITVEPKWKKRKRDVSPKSVCLKLIPMGTTNPQGDSMQLTTVHLETGNSCSPSSICQYLRHESHGVVGDSNCRQEYLKVSSTNGLNFLSISHLTENLKVRRSIRNRIKEKVCMGCYRIQVDGVQITKDVPEKLLWSFWDAHCETKNI